MSKNASLTFDSQSRLVSLVMGTNLDSEGVVARAAIQQTTGELDMMSLSREDQCKIVIHVLFGINVGRSTAGLRSTWKPSGAPMTW